MVLALLTIIRPLQVPPVWSVQKAAAEKIAARKHSQKINPRGTRKAAETRTAP
jgi:hypothetical protein